MKYLILIFFFVAVPYYLLSTLVMPELNQMKNFYSNIDAVANKTAGIK